MTREVRHGDTRHLDLTHDVIWGPRKNPVHFRTTGVLEKLIRGQVAYYKIAEQTDCSLNGVTVKPLSNQKQATPVHSPASYQTTPNGFIQWGIEPVGNIHIGNKCAVVVDGLRGDGKHCKTCPSAPPLFKIAAS